MFLSDVDIKKAIEKGAITIQPFNEDQLQVVSRGMLKRPVIFTYNTIEQLIVTNGNNNTCQR